MVETYRPESLLEALEIRSRGALPFGGGTDLMVARRGYTGSLPRFDGTLLFTDRVAELRRVTVAEDVMEIGAAVTMTELLDHPETPALLREALALIAAPGIRNRATLGGNIGNASPAGDSLVPLYLYDTQVELRSLTGTRTLPLKELISGVRRLTLGKDELITRILLPLTDFSFTRYRKVGTRRANALSKLSFAGALTLGDDGTIKDLRIALGAVAPTVVRQEDTEQTFLGIPLKTVNPDEAARKWADAVTPIDDQRSTAAYRKQVALNLIAGFIRKAQEEL